MKITIEPGTYVVAVSGGVDSMVLLDLLRQQPGVNIIIAHFDHGIRADSAEERQLVQAYAITHNLPFIYDEAKLGSETSEEKAREARYKFLLKVQRETKADAIITAHHLDDVIETAVFNVLRGTGRKGLSSLANTPVIKRPLLEVTKHQILKYAKAHNLSWREDSTNKNTKYKRNYIRHKILPKLNPKQKDQLLSHLKTSRELNRDIDKLLDSHLEAKGSTTQLDRQWFVALPHAVAKEVMASWLRRAGIQHFDRKLLEQLVVAAKTYMPGKLANIGRNQVMEVKDKILALVTRDR